MNDPSPSSPPSVRLTKTALLAIAVGLCVAGKRISTWPLQTWPMYSTTTTAFPPPHASTIELRVVAADGGVERLDPWDLVPFDGSEIAATILQHAFEDGDPRHRDADRAYLIERIGRRRPDAATVIVEGWRLQWSVDPMALPPLRREEPTTETRLGSFTASRLPQPGRP